MIEATTFQLVCFTLFVSGWTAVLTMFFVCGPSKKDNS